MQLFKEVVHPRMPCCVPGHLQGLAGGRQGQEVRGRGQYTAVWADSVMSCCLEWDVVPGRKFGSKLLLILLVRLKREGNHEPSKNVYRSVYLRVTDSGRENGARVTSVVDLSDLIRHVV